MIVKNGADEVEITSDHIHDGADAHSQYMDGVNPPSWVSDEDTWAKAKDAALKTYDLDDDAFWPATVAIYENMGGEVDSGESSKAKEKRSQLNLVRSKGRKFVIKGAHGELTGKPTFSSLCKKVCQEVQEDPRFTSGEEMYPGCTPYCCDILVPDDDGQMEAVVRDCSGTYFRVPFTWDGSEVKLADGEPAETEATTVYSREMKTHDKKVKAAGSADGAKAGHAARKTETAYEHSAAAHDASSDAHESGEEEDHEAAHDAHSKAADSHEAAYKAHAKAGGSRDHMDAHLDHIKMHHAAMEAHTHHMGEDDDDVKAKGATKRSVIHCRGASVIFAEAVTWEVGHQVEFMYMPGGINTICAGFRDGAVQMTVNVTKATADIIQASFDEWRKELPKLEPFGCVEHREQEASVHPKAFAWKDSPEPAVYMAAEPTALGAENVNGKIHRSWSPSFTTDAEYAKAVDKNGVLYFPDGVRGSESNPAEITGIDFCVGTLTNKPAFHNMSPVKATGETADSLDAIYARFEAQEKELQGIYKKVPAAKPLSPLEAIYAKVGVDGHPADRN